MTLGMDIIVGLPGEQSGRFIVPDVTGELLRRATASLDAAGLAWGVGAASPRRPRPLICSAATA